MEPQRSRRRRWLTAYAPLAIWIAVIIGLGSGLGAMNETSRFIRPLLEFLFPGTSPETLSVYHGYVRKLAHLMEYGILAVLARRALVGFKRPDLGAITIVFVIASIDEINQSFNSARTGTPVDVAIDLLGGVVGLAIGWMFRKAQTRRSTPSPELRG